MKFNIYYFQLEKLKKNISKLQKTAKKLGLEEPTILIGEPYWKKNSVGNCLATRFVEVDIGGVSPRVNGWVFIASLEHTKDGDNIIRRVPNNDTYNLFEYRTRRACDHCNVNRYRKVSFVLVNEKGEIIQVGKSCLKDFLGYKSPEYYVRLAQFLVEIEEKCYNEDMNSKQEVAIHQTEFMSVVAQFIIDHGYVKRSETNQGTASDAWGQFFLNPSIKEDMDRKIDISDRAVKLAKKTLKFISEFTEYDLKNEFKYNIHVTYKQKFVELKYTGVMSYAVQMYLNHVSKMEEVNKLKISKHVGEVKERREFDLEFIAINSYESQYGENFFYKFVDEIGNLIVWSTTKVLSMDIGTKIKLKGTVKKHDEFQGVKQTYITRCVIIE